MSDEIPDWLGGSLGAADSETNDTSSPIHVGDPLQLLLRYGADGNERGIAEVLVQETGVSGMLWLSVSDSLVTSHIPGAVSRDWLEKEASVFVASLTKDYNLDGSSESIDVDADEGTIFDPDITPSWNRIEPVLVGEKCIGGFMLFAESELEVDERIVKIAVAGFDVAFKFRMQQKQIDRASDRLSEIGQVGEIFASVGDSQRTINRILELAKLSSDAEVAAFIHKNADGEVGSTGVEMRTLSLIKFADGQDVVEKAMALEKELILFGSELTEALAPDALPLASLAIFPLVHESKRYGAMIMANQPLDLLTEKTYIATMVTISCLAASAITSEERQKDQLLQQAVQADLDAASIVQQSLLPQNDPDMQGIEIAGISKPYRGIGGDFYDFFVLSESLLGLMIGDVSGKGIPAGLMMAMAHSYLRVIAKDHLDSPARAMEILNNLLEAEFEDTKFITAAYIIIDVKNHVAKLANAGHHPPIFLKQDGSVEEVESGGLPLGIMDDSEYDDVEFQFDAGNQLILFTDALVEVQDENSNLLDTEGLMKLIEGKQDKTPQELIDFLFKETMEYGGPEGVDDDWTAVIVRYSEQN